MRVRLRRRLVVCLLISTAAGVTLAQSASAGEHLTRKAFQKEANQVCQVAYDAIAKVFENTLGGVGSGDSLPPERIAAAANGALFVFRGSLDRIEGLDGPAAYEKQVDRMLDQYRVVADRIEHDPQIIFDDRGIFGKPDNVARRLGLRRCVQEPSRNP